MAVEVISNNNNNSTTHSNPTSEVDFEEALHKATMVPHSPEPDVTETESSENYDLVSPNNNNNPASDTDQPNMVNGEDWNNITKPGEHDVLLGRGGGTNNHSGNIKFRKLVNEHKMRYLACSKVDKPKVARQVVAIWRKLEPTGRFLSRKDDTKRGPGSVKNSDNVWFEVGDKKAREKASQCLRERTPDVIPYIKHLREQQNAITEQGVTMVQMQMQQHEQNQHHPNNTAMAMVNPHSPMSSHHPVMSPHHQSPYPYMDPSGQANSPYHAPHTFPRRNSMPNQPNISSPFQHSPVNPDGRRGSLPMAPMGPQDMSEMEYQQQMMMMHQNMMSQQLQMQHLHNTRMRHAQHQRFDSPTHSVEQPLAAPSGEVATPPSANKRSRDSPEDDDDSAKDNRPTAPDRAISLMSLTPADPDNHELSLEDYREQLERYIANSGGVHDGAESDLEDDWERERERALLQHRDTTTKTRGVGRNISGMSCFSTKSNGNMSLVSGFSGLSDLSKNNNNHNHERESKMNMARSVCSNLSLMSELTDLSHNIDNLSIYDE